jgi:HAD superfamily hydrolase (TIGR01509 family)
MQNHDTLSDTPQRGPFAAAIFDMDGLLLDSERVILDAWQEVARAYGTELKRETYLQLIGRRGADVRALFLSLLPEGFPFDEARVRVQEIVTIRRAREGFSVKPGVRTLLARLAATNIPCAVASSTRLEEVERRLGSVALRAHFATVVGGDEVEHGKPAPDIFLLAAMRLAVPPAECIVFEDVEHGGRAAIAAGMQVVIVPDLQPPSVEAQRFSLAVLPTLEHTDASFAAWFVGRVAGA